MRTAWIFELAPSSSAALLRAKLARLEPSGCASSAARTARDRCRTNGSWWRVDFKQIVSSDHRLGSMIGSMAH